MDSLVLPLIMKKLMECFQRDRIRLASQSPAVLKRKCHPFSRENLLPTFSVWICETSFRLWKLINVERSSRRVAHDILALFDQLFLGLSTCRFFQFHEFLSLFDDVLFFTCCCWIWWDLQLSTGVAWCGREIWQRRLSRERKDRLIRNANFHSWFTRYVNWNELICSHDATEW